MVGSAKKTILDHHRAHHNNLMDNNDNQNENPSIGIACSICLDLVLDNGARSRAKLHCGHEFHLDCIGSAFNMKGAMQCPNCRKIEKGQWLYANGSARPLHELSTDDWIPSTDDWIPGTDDVWIPDEDFHDLSYSELQYGLHWCPFGGELTGAGSFEEVESPSTTYHEMRGNHSIYAENSTVSSVAHSYVAYFGPVPPTSATPSDSVDDPNFHHHWNGMAGHSEIFDRRAIPAINVQYRSWGRHSPPFASSSSQLSGASIPSVTSRSSTSELEARTRSTSFPHPIIFGSGSGPTAPNSFGSSIAPRHPSGSTHPSERIHHASRHRLISSNSPAMAMPIIHGNRRFDARRLPTPQQDHSGGFIIIPSNPLGLNLHAWERDQTPPFVSFHHQSRGSDSNDGANSLWHWLSS